LLPFVVVPLSLFVIGFNRAASCAPWPKRDDIPDGDKFRDRGREREREIDRETKALLKFYVVCDLGLDLRLAADLCPLFF